MMTDKKWLAPRVARRAKRLGRAARGVRGRRIRARAVQALAVGTFGAVGALGIFSSLGSFGLGGLGARILPIAQAAPSQFLDVPATFQMMRDSRDRVLNHRAAVKYESDARANLKAARANLSQAKDDRQEAINGLAEAQTGLKSSQEALTTLLTELDTARTESAARTREAIAAQQAVADMEPEYYARATQVQELAARLERLEANRPYTPSAGGVGSYATTPGGVIAGADATRAERIRREWERVGYEPGYLEEIRARVDRGIAAEVAGYVYADDGGVAAEEAEAYEAEVEAAQSEYDEAEAELGELESEYQSLVDARADAEAEEAEARANVRELEAEKATAIADVRAAEEYLASAEEFDRATIAELATAETELETSERDYSEAEHGLRHFGEGVGAALNTEYYHWNGASSTGHQLVQSYEASYETPQVSVGLSTGYVSGSVAAHAQGGRDGHSGSVSHMTDTTISARYRNNHKLNDTHYLLDINIPTGDSDASPFASVPSFLARYTTYGEGFGVTPGIEGIRHLNETDTLSIRGTYALRYSYTTQGYNDGYYSGGTWIKEPLTMYESRVYPGDQMRAQLSYLHAGEHDQIYSFVAYQQNKKSRTLNYRTHNYETVRDGDGWEAAIYYNEQLNKLTEGEVYFHWSQDGATGGSTSGLNRGMTYYMTGAGVRYQLEPSEHVSLLVQYLRGRGAADSWRTGLGNMDPTRISVLLGYEKRFSDRDSLRLELERYTLHDKSSGNYNGWSAGLFLNHSF